MSPLVALLLFAATQAPEGRAINPGVLGANALPTYPGEAPWVGDDALLSIGWAGQLSTPLGGGLDQSMLATFRLELPIARRVAIISEGAGFELFQYSPETRALWSPRRSKGITPADVLGGFKMLVMHDKGARPAVAFRFITKTATGERLNTRRFTDMPAYLVSLIAGWRTLVGTVRGEAWLHVGFYSWQQGQAGQNDALALGGTVAARWPHVSAVVDLRGYAGWQRFDAPVTLAAQVELQLFPAFDVVLGASRTFQDPPSFELRATARLRLPMAAIDELFH